MTERKLVKGLFDIVEAEAEGKPWRLPSTFVPGLGLGTTEQARRWAWLGMQTEMANAIERVRKAKRPAGRPQKHPYETKAALCAMVAWHMVQVIRDAAGDPRAKITNREIIREITDHETKQGISKHAQTFNRGETGDEQVLSRGKKILEINANWDSEVCEKLWQEMASFHQ